MGRIRTLLTLLLASVSLLFLLAGCNALVEGHDLRVTENIPELSPDIVEGDFIPVETPEELEQNILSMVRNRIERGLFRIDLSTLDDVEAMVVDVVERLGEVPLVAYAVSSFGPWAFDEGQGYVNLDIGIVYGKTAEQIANVQTVSNAVLAERFLSQMLREGEPYFAMLSPLNIASIHFIEQTITDYYYGQALNALILPQVQIGLYPSSGPGAQRIAVVEMYFGFNQHRLAQMRGQLREAAQTLIDEMPEDLSPPQQIIHLAEALAAVVAEPLEEIPRAEALLSELRPISTTAFGAFVQGSATSEGYAMAFKALLDLLEIESHVVQGERESRPHVWNLVQIGEYYYHMDIFLLEHLGPELTLFLDDMALLQNGYGWDMRRYPLADGPGSFWYFAR